MNISEKLKGLRIKHNVTLKKMASEINVGTSTIGDLENGVSQNPRIDTLLKICDYFNVDISYFMNDNVTSIQSDEIYYWLSYYMVTKLGCTFNETVSKVHPFEVVKKMNINGESEHYTLLNYKEINRLEYDFFTS